MYVYIYIYIYIKKRVKDFCHISYSLSMCVCVCVCVCMQQAFSSNLRKVFDIYFLFPVVAGVIKKLDQWRDLS